MSFLSESFNNFDVVVLVVIIFSAVVGLFRGFSGESTSTVRLLLSMVMPMYLIPLITPLFPNKIIVSVTVFCVVFFICLFVLKIFALQVAFLIKVILPSFIDKPLGIIFGIFKSTILCGFVYFLLISVNHKFLNRKMDMVEDAKTKNIMDISARAILFFVPKVEYDEENIAENNFFALMLGRYTSSNEDSMMSSFTKKALGGQKPYSNYDSDENKYSDKEVSKKKRKKYSEEEENLEDREIEALGHKVKVEDLKMLLKTYQSLSGGENSQPVNNKKSKKLKKSEEGELDDLPKMEDLEELLNMMQ